MSTVNPEPPMRPLALALPLMLFACADARAGFVTYKTDFVYGSSFVVPDGSIPLFDPSQFGGAKLTGVTIRYEVNASAPSVFYAENLTGDFLDLRVEFSDTASFSIYGANNANLFSGVLSVSPIETTLDPFGYISADLNSLLTGAYSAPDVSPFVGTGDFQFFGSHDFYPEFVSAPDQVYLYVAPDWVSSGTATVTYTYSTPAPSGVAFVIGAAPFAALLRRGIRPTRPSSRRAARA